MGGCFPTWRVDTELLWDRPPSWSKAFLWICTRAFWCEGTGYLETSVGEIAAALGYSVGRRPVPSGAEEARRAWRGLAALGVIRVKPTKNKRLRIAVGDENPMKTPSEYHDFPIKSCDCVTKKHRENPMKTSSGGRNIIDKKYNARARNKEKTGSHDEGHYEDWQPDRRRDEDREDTVGGVEGDRVVHWDFQKYS